MRLFQFFVFLILMSSLSELMACESQEQIYLASLRKCQMSKENMVVKKCIIEMVESMSDYKKCEQTYDQYVFEMVKLLKRESEVTEHQRRIRKSGLIWEMM